MSQMGPDSRLEQLPYYRDYVEQILKPRVLRLVDEVRGGLSNHAWTEVIRRLAEEQRPGSGSDQRVVEQMRFLLQEILRLRLGIDLSADFDASGDAEAAPAAPKVEAKPTVEVVERGFPDNPLARAVGGMRKAAR